MNLRGELVGINTAIISRSGGYEGIGFAIPVDMAHDVLRQLVEYGEVKRGLLGVEITDLDDVTAEALGMQNTRGVFVRSVREDGPAKEAGVEQGDVILAVDGNPTRSTTALRSLIGASPPATNSAALGAALRAWHGCAGESGEKPMGWPETVEPFTRPQTTIQPDPAAGGVYSRMLAAYERLERRATAG